MTTVLVVDDKHENILFLNLLLKHRGYTVQMAANGREALDLAQLKPPDLIISDILMPIMDGFAFCRACKQDAALKNVPFIFYTATYTDARDERFALGLGADRFLIKPMEPEALLTVITELLASHAAGKLQSQRAPEPPETELMKEYNQALIRKLEDKMSELERTNRLLSESETRYRSLFDGVPVGLYRATPDGQVLDANPALVQMLGYPDVTALQSIYTADGYVEPELRKIWQQQLEHDGRVLDFEFRWRCPDGRVIWLNESSRTVRRPDGTVLHYEGALQDITDRKRAELQSQQQIERLKALRAIDTAISTSLDLRVTARTFFEQASALLGVHAATVLLLEPHSRTLSFAAAFGFQTQMVEGTLLPLGQGLAGVVAVERRLMAVPNLLEHLRGIVDSHPDLIPLLEMVETEGFVSYYALPLVVKGAVKGVLETFHRQRLDPGPDWLDFLGTLAGQMAIAVENALLFDNLQRSNIELSLAYETTLEGWSQALDLRDQETEGHTQRVTELAVRLAKRMGLDGQRLVHFRRGALLHDIGKMAIPDAILHKPGPLSDDEWVVMRKHPQYAHDLLVAIPFLRPALEIPYCHHERWDGTGYPHNLRGEQIPQGARIFAVVDVYDALISERTYRPAQTKTAALTYLREQAGKQFDPQAVATFLEMIAEQDSKPARLSGTE
jgi:PAS domain S-box-containing protein/putative nucleotidyltransferase with HDIG domain